jgi:hypothetical protein
MLSFWLMSRAILKVGSVRPDTIVVRNISRLAQLAFNFHPKK